MPLVDLSQAKKLKSKIQYQNIFLASMQIYALLRNLRVYNIMTKALGDRLMARFAERSEASRPAGFDPASRG